MGNTKIVVRRDRVNTDGFCVIYVLYTHDSKNTYISTGEKISLNLWDFKKCLARKTYRGYTILNELLQKKKSEIDEIRLSLRLQDREPTAALVKAKYNESLKPRESKTIGFWDRLNEFIDYKKNVTKIAHSTYKQFKTFQRHLKEFEHIRNRKIRYDNINQSFYKEYISYLFDELEMSPNTVGSQIKQLRTFLNWSLENGLSDNLEYKQFKKPSHTPNSIALTKKELDQFFEHKFSNKRLERIRDIFIFSCVTALRYSDYKRIGTDNIIGDLIVIHAQKTKESVRIPLNDYSRHILEKHAFEMRVPSNQTMNDSLKAAAREAGLGGMREYKEYNGREPIMMHKPLHEIIGTHMGRKTFITVMLEAGKVQKNVMRISGHKNISSFQRYIDAPDKQLIDDSNEVFKLNSTT